MPVPWGHLDPAPGGVPHRQSPCSDQLEVVRVVLVVVGADAQLPDRSPTVHQPLSPPQPCRAIPPGVNQARTPLASTAPGLMFDGRTPQIDPDVRRAACWKNPGVPRGFCLLQVRQTQECRHGQP